MAHFWQIVFYQPLFNLLVLIYNLVGGNMGLAIVVLTVVLKIVLYPLSGKALKSQKALQELQPKVDELKARLGDKKELMAKELMALYQKEKVSPFSSCLPLLVQLPFLFALYQVFRSGLASGSLELLYPFVHNPGHLADTFFVAWHLSSPSWVLGVLTAAAQYWQSKMLVTSKQSAVAGAKDEGMTAAMNKQMLYLLPAMTFFFSLTLPGGLILYWLVNTVLTIGQQYLTFRHPHAIKPSLS